MKKITFLLLLTINWISGSSQPVVFNNNYGTTSEDVGFSSVYLPDGNHLSLGWTEGTSNGLSDFYLVKTNADGDILWKRTYGYADRESGLSLTQSIYGGFILAGSGRSQGNGASDCLIFRTDDDGNEMWHKTFGFSGEDYLRSLEELPNGELLICGYTDHGNGSKNLLAAKLSASGNPIWWESVGGYEEEEGWTVTADQDGNSYFGGWTKDTNNGNSDYLLVKKSPSGSTLFIKTYGGNNVDSGLKLLVDENKLIFAGSSHSYGNGQSDVLLLNLDLNGNQISQKTFGGSNHDYCRSICKTDDGFAITGFTRNFGAIGNDIFIAFTNDSLEVVNHSVIVEPNDQEGWDIDYLGDHAFLLTGKGISTNNGDNDMKLIKLDYYALNTNNYQGEDWEIIPNPAINEIQVKNADKDFKISLYNSEGKLISIPTINLNRIDVSNLPTGVYYITVQNNSYISSKKLIINK